MVSISMCMIVKNEAAILSRCLDSYSGTYDELIIVDTGSTDNTKEIAAKYTTKIYDFTWINDFSAARNYAFSLCRGDYILSVDADEELDSLNNQHLKDLKSILLPEIEIVQMYYVNCCQYNSVYNSKKELRPKLFKRLRTFTWISQIHETVRTQPVVFDSDIEIMHKPTGSHSERDLKAFANALGNGAYLENYVVSMLCKELYMTGTPTDFLEFEPYFEDRLCLEDRPFDISYSIAIILAKIYRLKSENANFLEITKEAACSDSVEANSSEMYIEIGLFYEAQKKLPLACLYYKKAMEASPMLDVKSGSYTPMCALARIYDELSLCTSDTIESNNYRDLANQYHLSADNWRMPEINC